MIGEDRFYNSNLQLQKFVDEAKQSDCVELDFREAARELLALRKECADWRECSQRFADWLENVHIDYRNDNVAPNGMDEGEELGWKGHQELIKGYTYLVEKYSKAGEK